MGFKQPVHSPDELQDVATSILLVCYFLTKTEPKSSGMPRKRNWSGYIGYWLAVLRSHQRIVEEAILADAGER